MRFMHSNTDRAAVATLLSGLRVARYAIPKHLLVPLKLRWSSFGAVPLRL